ncbi:hypothetical protein LTR85_008310 [Meristemomyces frigidus]|nr:hypothetical protein LTR85_008310 [Meristemomyces frigidus]
MASAYERMTAAGSHAYRRVCTGRDYEQLADLWEKGNAIVTRELQRPAADAPLSPQAECLRRALQYILCVDYGLPVDHFADYCNRQCFLKCAGMMKDMQRMDLWDEQWVQLGRNIKRSVADPALELGLPVHFAMQMLLRFSITLVDGCAYKGCHDVLYERHGVDMMFYTINTDRSVVFKAVVSRVQLRSQFWKKEKVEAQAGEKQAALAPGEDEPLDGPGYCTGAVAVPAHVDAEVERICEGLKELRGWPSLAPQVAGHEAEAPVVDFEKQ